MMRAWKIRKGGEANDRRFSGFNISNRCSLRTRIPYYHKKVRVGSFTSMPVRVSHGTGGSMLNFRIRYTTNVGEVGVNINGVGYVYFIDAGFIPAIEELAKCQSGKALNDLKRLAYHCERKGGDR